MQSRLEEEEEAKAALMSRIQRLTKLILVSSKNTIPGLTDVSSHQRSLSANEDDVGYHDFTILLFYFFLRRLWCVECIFRKTFSTSQGCEKGDRPFDMKHDFAYIFINKCFYYD